ncbi:MAG: 30S ribosomal protein S19, partial [Candidatus Magasanikbacteria bacterium]|nr:30S ribosomal protein S19 [Candidatus Magasanikbacteria bacterium]
RSLKKGPYVDEGLLQKVLRAKGNKSHNPIKTWARDCTITPEMVGMTFQVHNGKNFLDVFVEENKVGHKLGEFAPTRKFIVHGGRMAKEQAKTAAGPSVGAVVAPVAAAPAPKAK